MTSEEAEVKEIPREESQDERVVTDSDKVSEDTDRTTEISATESSSPTRHSSDDAENKRQNNKVMLNSVGDSLYTHHPLQTKWTLWYLKGDRSKDWEACLKEVCSFNTVEDFWALYNSIQPASALCLNSDYYLFKDGIKPMWEDENNISGGRWLVVIDKQRRNQQVDEYWLELLMAMIGEQFEGFGSQICGAVVNIRQKGDKVSLWTRDSMLDEDNLRIGLILKYKLKIPDAQIMRYEVHKDSSQRTSSTVKPKIILPNKER